jgi:hypothetical protein
MLRTVIRGGLLLAALALLGAQKKEGKPPVYKTPQDAFDAFVAADDKGDFQTLVGCLAPEAVKVLTLELILRGREMRDDAEGRSPKEKGGRDMSEKEAKALKPVFDVMEKHGVTVKAAKDFAVNKGTKEERMKARRQLLALVKDQPRFCADYAAALRKSGKFSRFAPRKDLGVKLAGLKIDGDKATGESVIIERIKDAGTLEWKRPIAFAKGDNGWRVVPSPDKPLDGRYFDPWGVSVKR